ncbi:FMN-binding protein [Desulfosarcina cetonica]|uniref:FMN-binding protein n=1 Tax=Desulfosarcina cetonica TaxID=90730 RepID=UPI0006D16B27|nr:FMN-binding protein [Desulfosarcina cetonica]
MGLIKAGASMSAAEIERRYDANIRCYDMAGTGRVVPADKAGAGLPVCFYVKANHPKAYIVPVDSSGLWGKIHGYMAIENDGKTVAGFSVYSQNETPGLGGEIEKPWFQKNFVGKKIVDKAGDFVSVGIAKGKVAEVIPKDRQDNYVDGISGASLTGKFLTAGLKSVLRKYEPLAKAFRKGPVSLPAGS